MVNGQNLWDLTFFSHLTYARALSFSKGLKILVPIRISGPYPRVQVELVEKGGVYTPAPLSL
jgi:hypothetical protein